MTIGLLVVIGTFRTWGHVRHESAAPKRTSTAAPNLWVHALVTASAGNRGLVGNRTPLGQLAY